MIAQPTDEQQLKRQFRQFKRQQAETEAVFASIGQGAIATDKDGKISHVNQAALDMLGCKRSELVGKWFPAAIIAEDSTGKSIKPMDRPITKAFLTGKAVNEKMFYHHKNGTALPVSITVSPILLNKKPIGAIEVFRDITHELEVDRMKTEFIYLASHQLRTPLTAVKTYAHMLNDGYTGSLKPHQKDMVETILSSMDRMNDIINTLLNISRLEAGKLSLQLSSTLIVNIVDQSLIELQPTIRNKKIRVHTNIPQQDTIMTDPILAKEVCLNLLSNAIKYTPEGGQISVSVRHTPKEQILKIQDTGYGIPKASKNQIFSKFYRAPNVLDKNESGTGLGLYLVKGLAQALGGRVWFESEESKGTTFYFSIPVKPPSGSP